MVGLLHFRLRVHSPCVHICVATWRAKATCACMCCDSTKATRECLFISCCHALSCMQIPCLEVHLRNNFCRNMRYITCNSVSSCAYECSRSKPHSTKLRIRASAWEGGVRRCARARRQLRRVPLPVPFTRGHRLLGVVVQHIFSNELTTEH